MMMMMMFRLDDDVSLLFSSSRVLEKKNAFLVLGRRKGRRL